MKWYKKTERTASGKEGGKHTTGGYLSMDGGANRIIGFIRLEIAVDTRLG